MEMKLLRRSWLLVAILTCGFFFVSCHHEDNPIDEEQQLETEFQTELDQAMSVAQIYGPPTQSLAEEVASRHNGKPHLLTTRLVRVPSANAVPKNPDPSN